MTSKCAEIQELYNKIENYRVDGLLPTQQELNKYIENLLGASAMYINQPLHYRNPFGILKREAVLGYFHNIIMFVDRGVGIVMNNDILAKIPILRSIIIDGNGADKPLRLKGYYEKEEIKGSLLYLTKLPLDGLYFDTPKEDYNVKRYDASSPVEPIKKYCMFDNVEEALIHNRWYS